VDIPAVDRRGPLAGTQPRLVSLDVVRGVAVLGIVIANIIGLGQPLTASAWPGAFLTDPGPLADWLWGAQLVLVDGKLRGVFTLLFGAGLVLFHRRADARGDGYGLLARRLLWLGVFGFGHWSLLWRGDILLSYAVAGLVVMWFITWDWQKQLTLGLIGYALGALVYFASSVPTAWTAGGEFQPGSSMAELQASLTAIEAAELADIRSESALMVSGDHAGLIAHTLGEHLPSLPNEVLIGLFETAPLMLIGMALMSAGLFDRSIAAHRQRAWGSGLWVTGTLATVPIAAWAIGGGLTYWDSFAAIVGWSALPRLLAALGLVGLLALWGRQTAGRLAKLFAAAGRCAFSNYIGTSALALVIFAGWGFGLYGQLTRLELYGVAVLVCAILLAWPAWWLSRFHYGPLEWLWRCLTYRQRFPLRR
jgi:uncharacterized protein